MKQGGVYEFSSGKSDEAVRRKKPRLTTCLFPWRHRGYLAFWEPMEPERPQRSGQYWVSWKLMRGKPSGTAGKSTGRRWLSVICRRSAASMMKTKVLEQLVYFGMLRGMKREAAKKAALGLYGTP